MTFESVEELIDYRMWAYKRLKHRYKIICDTLNISSIILTAVGTGVGVLVPPVLSVNGLPILIQSVLKYKKYSEKIEQCRIAIVRYEQLHSDFKFLNGDQYLQENKERINKIDNEVMASAPTISNDYYDKYLDHKIEREKRKNSYRRIHQK